MNFFEAVAEHKKVFDFVRKYGESEGFTDYYEYVSSLQLGEYVKELVFLEEYNKEHDND